MGALRPLPFSSSSLELYAHAQKGGSYGDAGDMLAALSAAAQQEASAAQVRVQFQLLLPPLYYCQVTLIQGSHQGVFARDISSTHVAVCACCCLRLLLR